MEPFVIPGPNIQIRDILWSSTPRARHAPRAREPVERNSTMPILAGRHWPRLPASRSDMRRVATVILLVAALVGVSAVAGAATKQPKPVLPAACARVLAEA